MNDLISPRYQMRLIKDIEKKLWSEFEKSGEISFYIEKWHVYDGYDQNFSIERYGQAYNAEIDLSATLNNIDGTTLLKIAIDLGVSTPDFIPSIPTFRNEIKSEYKTASATFEKAFKEIETHPDLAVGLANSALEGIIKEILKDERVNSKIKENDTLYALTSEILKAFQLYPDSTMPVEIKTIGSSLLGVCQGIEKLRSEKTNLHGKTGDDYVISDPLYTYFIVNSVTTVGLFLNSYFKNKFSKAKIAKVDDDDLPF